ncbi:MAG: hypothetical protein Q9227_004252 [Pyrenula ochraceoflavens]
MSPTPPSTTSSSAGGPHSPETNQFRVVRKRNRVPLSCAPCRHRKLKCNRSNPCENCVKRGDAASCTYAAPTARKKNSQSQGNPTSPDDMQNRIDRLEGLVLSLMTNGQQTPGPTAANNLLAGSMSAVSGREPTDGGDNEMMDGEDESDTDQVTQSLGVMKVFDNNTKTMYYGEAHWAAVLHGIREVRDYFATHKKEMQDQIDRVAANKAARPTELSTSGPALLFGASSPPSKDDILRQIPSRYMTDMLVARYFNTFDPAVHILHLPTFQKQYNKHWENPKETSLVWVAMLFAICRMAMYSYHRDGDEPPEVRGKCLDMAANFRTQMTHCLISADYTKPHNFLIETLVFHLHGEYIQNQEADASVWVLVGMIARLAMRMGYHRDSKWFPNITPFQGEMRRRVWTFVRQSDLLFSFQVSLPSMIRIGDSDTELPRNIHDDEFDEDSKTLPEPHPSSEITQTSYMISKARISFGFGRVLELLNSVHPAQYEEVMKIDNGLREIHDSLPAHLKYRTMQEQCLDTVITILSRFNLETLYHKTQCVLHRKFLRPARTNPRYVHSRRTCLDSAMALLRMQDILHSESGAHGRMRKMKWYTYSLTAHDFLLAATMIAQDLYQGFERAQRNPETPDVYTWGIQSREDMITALEKSRNIWRELQDESMDAFKAAELLTVMLEKITVETPEQQGLTQATAAGATAIPVQSSYPDLGPADEKQNAALTLGLLSSGGLSPNSAAAAGVAPQQTAPQQQVPFSTPFGLGSGSAFESRGAIDALLQPSSGNMSGRNSAQGQIGGGTGMDGIANMASPNGGPFIFGSWGNDMNLDWDAWDTYMQPQSNLDPANTLWSTGLTPQPFPPPSPVPAAAATTTTTSSSNDNNTTSPSTNTANSVSAATPAGNINPNLESATTQPQGMPAPFSSGSGGGWSGFGWGVNDPK